MRTGDLCVTVPMVLLGVYGTLTCWKYRERTSLHNRQIRTLYAAIADEHPELGLRRVKSEPYARHEARSARTARIRLYVLRMSLHIGVALGGVFLSVWIVAAR
ncbi:hypothetical protein PV341_34610 [Streptomyces sp. PA03-1a]|nr:hypothetical protein [Streptomyces sp. PA03-1a]MDX2815628.1 hypothetical protein [Streptomyces sp. PA03-5A]